AKGIRQVKGRHLLSIEVGQSKRGKVVASLIAGNVPEDDIGDGQGPFHHLRQRVADLNVLPIDAVGAAPKLVGVSLVNASQLVGAVVWTVDVAILPRLCGGIPLCVDAESSRRCDECSCVIAGYIR